MNSTENQTISLPPDLVREAEQMARSEGKTVSAVIEEALRQARRGRLNLELREIQGYWSRLAREKGILSEEDLEQFLAGEGSGHMRGFIDV